MPEELNLELIPPDQLCTLCHLVLKRFKSQLEGQVVNEDEFKLSLVLGCMQLRTPEEVLKCQKSIDPGAYIETSANHITRRRANSTPLK
ncbi:hypothetical protein Ddc_13493 [Ditylenchus destructor]|nr:hypothetical protein Ddc_13493 [Ditylenchus destructor]